MVVLISYVETELGFLFGPICSPLLAVKTDSERDSPNPVRMVVMAVRTKGLENWSAQVEVWENF